MVNKAYPWLLRGGRYNINISAGIFSSDVWHGGIVGISLDSFRLVMSHNS